MTEEEQFRTTMVYISATLPWLYLLAKQISGKLAVWERKLALYGLALCILGWELWFTFGLAGGLPVSERRTEGLNQALPESINWFVNSSADMGIILIGVALVYALYGFRATALTQWRWGGFAILTAWFIGQNVAVEMLIYHNQLAAGLELSWAPMAPTGNWWNPVLLTIGDRTATLQGQWPWFIMTPLVYGLIIRLRGAAN